MDRVPSPGEVGLPPKFDKWRAGQEEAILFIINSDKRATITCAPTGFGKSPVVVAAALLSKKPTCIVTASRSLQDQYMSDFESIGMVDLRGRNNYKCSMRPDDPTYSCEQGYAARCPYKGTIGCDCSRAEMRAATSSLVVMNYAKWCAARKFGQGVEHFEHVIFDEGDQAFDALANVMQVVLHYREIEDKLQIDFPDQPAEFPDWKLWAIPAKIVAENEMIQAQNRIAGVADPKPTWVKHFTHMRNLTRRLSTLATASSRDWIVDSYQIDGQLGGYQFDPIHPGKYGESALLMRVPKVTFISATIRPKSVFMVGLGAKQFDFKEFSSSFNAQRCPIYYLPTMRVDARNLNRELLWLKCDQIMAPRQGVKGLIQTTSYDTQRDVQTYSRFAGNMLLNPRGEVPTEMVERFKASGPGTRLVSPSIGIGQDFKDDYSRFNIALKVPFEPPSKILKAREADDKEYRGFRAIGRLEQQLGRDMRGEQDWREGFILDEHFGWFWPRYRHLASASFNRFIKEIDVVPPPLRFV